MGEHIEYTRQIKELSQDSQWTTFYFQSASSVGLTEYKISTSYWDKLGRPTVGDHIVFDISVKEFKK